MVNQKLGFITFAICFGYITTLTGLKTVQHILNDKVTTIDLCRANNIVVRSVHSFVRKMTCDFAPSMCAWERSVTICILLKLTYFARFCRN